MPRRLEDVIGRTRDIASSIVAANAARTDLEARWPEENFRALLAADLGGLLIPQADGGLGLGMVALARVCEELAFFCPSTAIGFGMHHVAAAVLSAKATPQQKQQYLAPIAAGEHLTTLALSEPGTGSHFYLPQIQLRETAAGYEVTGAKSFVTNGVPSAQRTRRSGCGWVA